MNDRDALDLFGTVQPPTPYRVLAAGPLEVCLEGGNLRYITYQGYEVLRAVAYVVRDRDWGTLVPEIREMKIDEGPTAFSVAYTALYRNKGAELSVETRIVGTESGALSFTTKALASSDFETNRCGFNILHPINGVAGAPVTVEHCDGTINETVFPDLIDPWQPFMSIRALTHAPAPHLSACCRMEGDEFEMEDQRNWSDASYKTYVRPLALPWPYSIEAGKELDQSVSLEISATNAPPSRRNAGTDTDQIIEISLDNHSGASMPEIGLLCSPEDIDITLSAVDVLNDINPYSVLCHLDPTAGHGLSELKSYRSLQEDSTAVFDLEYVVACEGELEAEFSALVDRVAQSGLVLGSLAVCPSVDRQSTPPGSTWPECPPLEDIYRAARKAFPETVLGGGMFSYFTELNRKRPPIGFLNFVTHATNPIVHAADDKSVMETLETLPHITRSARAIMGAEMEYRLGPSTIGMRQNPYGSRTFDNPDGARICMAHDDPRQRGAFAAAWTAGYAAAIADAGIARWVPSSIAGPRGLLDGTGASLLPVGNLVRQLTKRSGQAVRKCRVSDPGRIAALGFEADGEQKVLVSNLTPVEQRIRLEKDRTIGPYEIVWL